MSNWQDRAACAGLDSEFFFADSSRHVVEAALPGMEVCRTCPVTRECLDFAQDEKLDYGIFGGKTTEERRAMRRLRIRSVI